MTMIHRILVILTLSKNKILALLAQAWAVHNAMLAEQAIFVSPVPPLPTLLAKIQALEGAQQAMKTTPSKATTDARDARRDDLVSALESERAYVQTLCDASPDRALAILHAASMTTGKSRAHAKAVLAAKLGAGPGSVVLVANEKLLAGKHGLRVTFHWQSSADGGKTWLQAPSTPLAETEICGLTPMTVYAFRVCVTVSKETRPWSDAVTLLVR